MKKPPHYRKTRTPNYDTSNMITLMTDASFCPRTGASGYGVWFRTNNNTYQRGGNFKEDPKSAVEAEMMAVAIGVSLACKSKFIKEKPFILIQVDSQDAIRQLEKLAPANHIAMRVVKMLKKLSEEYDMKYRFRWVKGHAAGRAPRNYCNHICDRLAGQFMRSQREVYQQILVDNNKASCDSVDSRIQ